MSENRFDDDTDTDANPRPNRQGNWFTRLGMVSKLLLILGGVLVVLGLLLQFVILPNVVQSQGNSLQNSLMEDYGNSAATLHNCKAQAAGAANVAKAEVDALDKVLNNAVGGKFGNAKEGTFNQNDFVVAMRGLYPVSLYPDTKALSATFDKVMAIVTGCQENFLGQQKVVANDVKNLRDFRNASWFSRTYGGLDYPTSDLEINLPNVPRVTGKLALEQMARPIIDTSTAGAFGTGIDDGSLQGPFDNTPSATPTR
jgi:hypothetical protein